MRHSSEATCREILARLVEDFRAKCGDELKEVPSVNQDFISRPLFNSTARVSKILTLHYEYARKLEESLVQAIEKDYRHLRPSICETELTKIIESEYTRIGRKVAGWLQESQLLANPDILAS
jgi:hypothetical protein